MIYVVSVSWHTQQVSTPPPYNLRIEEVGLVVTSLTLKVLDPAHTMRRQPSTGCCCCHDQGDFGHPAHADWSLRDTTERVNTDMLEEGLESKDDVTDLTVWTVGLELTRGRGRSWVRSCLFHFLVRPTWIV